MLHPEGECSLFLSVYLMYAVHCFWSKIKIGIKGDNATEDGLLPKLNVNLGSDRN